MKTEQLNKFDAARILGLNGTFTADDVIKSTRKLRSQYHPDRNEHGTEMTKMINLAYDALKDGGSVNLSEGDADKNHSEAILAAIRGAAALDGVSVELCGVWVWVTGDTRPHRKTLGKAGLGFKFTKKDGQGMWYFRTGEYKSYRGRGKSSMDDIRTRYGSEKQTRRYTTAIAG